MMREDKQAICDALCKALQLTRSGSDISKIEYHAEGEYVTVYYTSGHININVAFDSGIAMIRDILRGLI